jgi:ATP-binding cassette subfamily C (CFTR/MRP) protein 1
MPYWLGLWAEKNGQQTWYYSGIYFVLTLGAFVSMTMTIANIFLFIAPKSGKILHSRLLRTVMAASQAYFATTDTGTTLNQFTTDIMMIDRALPQSLLQVVLSLFTLLSQAVLLAVVQPWMILTLLGTLFAVYWIQKFYLTTSRQLRFLELETKAIVNSSFLETLEGVATIRAFGWQRAFIDDNIKKLDLSLRPWYLLMCLQRWLNIVMDMIVLVIAMLVISLAVYFKGTITSGQVGIALNVVLEANLYLLRLVESWTRLETSLGAISRLRAFEKDVQPEDKPGEDREPSNDWPARGASMYISLDKLETC